MRTTHLALVGLALALGLALTARAEDRKAPLFNGKDLTGWRVVVPGKGDVKPEQVFSVKDGVLATPGKPIGYVLTEKDYSDYVLELEWRWPEKPGNSGVLLHVSGPDKVWPKSWEAQLFASRAGDIWLIDNFKLNVDKAQQDPKQARHFFRRKTDRPVEKKTGEWNKYRITCKGDTVKLEINGLLVNEGKGAERTGGKIALQAEGAPIEFRNIKLTPLK